MSSNSIENSGTMIIRHEVGEVHVVACLDGPFDDKEIEAWYAEYWNYVREEANADEVVQKNWLDDDDDSFLMWLEEKHGVLCVDIPNYVIIER